MTITDAARDRVLRATIVAELEAALSEEQARYRFPDEIPTLHVDVLIPATNDSVSIVGPVATLARLCALPGGEPTP